MEAILLQTKIKNLTFAAVLTMAAVGTPLIFHYFGGIEIGRTFLPMYFFVLLAGLSLNWRAALAVALFAPLLSHLISGMPVIAMMPVVMAELILYVLAVGCLSKKVSGAFLRVPDTFWVAMLAIFITKLVLAGILFLPTHLAASAYVLDSIKIGWQGILLQLVLAPFLAVKLRKYFFE